MTSDLFMVPPGMQNVSHKRVKKFHLRLQCTGDLFEMDERDWNNAKHCFWWFDAALGQPVNAKGIPFTTYVGITGVRKVEGVETMNFSRANYV